MRFFDSLVHATPDGRWLRTQFDASVDRLLAEMDAAGVTCACLVAIANVIDNHWMLQVARAHPTRFVPVGGINPAKYDTPLAAARAVEKLATEGFAGVKFHPRLNGYDPLDPRCMTSIQAAGDHGLVVLIDTLFRQRHRATHSAPDVIDHVANKCQETQCVLLHSAGAEMLELFELVRMHPHLVLDLSFTMLRYAGSSLDLDMRFLAENLNRSLTVGSDFPEYVPSQARAKTDAVCDGMPQEMMENIFYSNLARLFKNSAAVEGEA